MKQLFSIPTRVSENWWRVVVFLKNLPRMYDWISLTVLLFALVGWIAPQQLQVILYKSLLVSLAAVMTYWVDHSLFARASDRICTTMPRDVVTAARIASRALMFTACVIGMTMGL